MKTYAKITLRTKSGRIHIFEYNYNKHEVMKEKDLITYILSLPYLCTRSKEGSKTIVPRDAIDSLTIMGEDI